MQLQKGNDLGYHWKSHLLDISHARKHHPQNHIEIPLELDCTFFRSFLDFYFMVVSFLTQGNAHVVYH